jgi:hypothetical protein
MPTADPGPRPHRDGHEADRAVFDESRYLFSATCGPKTDQKLDAQIGATLAAKLDGKTVRATPPEEVVKTSVRVVPISAKQYAEIKKTNASGETNIGLYMASDLSYRERNTGFAFFAEVGDDVSPKSVEEFIGETVGKKMKLDDWQRDYLARVYANAPTINCRSEVQPVFGTKIHEFMEQFIDGHYTTGNPIQEDTEQMTIPSTDIGGPASQPPFYGFSLSSFAPIGFNKTRKVTLVVPSMNGEDKTLTNLTIAQARELLDAKRDTLMARSRKAQDKAEKASNMAAGAQQMLDALAKLERRDLQAELPAEPTRHAEELSSRTVARGAAKPTVVTFTKLFSSPDGRAYQYAAIREAGADTWVVTGKTVSRDWDWDRLMEFVVENELSDGMSSAPFAPDYRKTAIRSIMLMTEEGPRRLVDFPHLTKRGEA